MYIQRAEVNEEALRAFEDSASIVHDNPVYTGGRCRSRKSLSPC